MWEVTYGSVVFNLTFFHEVTRSNETLYRLHANVIDSCIDIIVGRSVIREHHLIQKIPIGDASDTIASEIESHLRAALHHMHPICVARI